MMRKFTIYEHQILDTKISEAFYIRFFPGYLKYVLTFDILYYFFQMVCVIRLYCECLKLQKEHFCTS